MPLNYVDGAPRPVFIDSQEVIVGKRPDALNKPPDSMTIRRCIDKEIAEDRKVAAKRKIKQRRQRNLVI